MNIFPHILILSAHRAGLTEESNEDRARSLAEQLAARQLPFSPVAGYYLGATEAGFAVVYRRNGDVLKSYELATVLTLADRYGQDSVLHLDANRAAWHLPVKTRAGDSPDKTAVYLGRWKEAPVDYVTRLDSWTQTADGRYWFVEEDRPDPGAYEARALSARVRLGWPAAL